MEIINIEPVLFFKKNVTSIVRTIWRGKKSIHKRVPKIKVEQERKLKVCGEGELLIRINTE